MGCGRPSVPLQEALEVVHLLGRPVGIAQPPPQFLQHALRPGGDAVVDRVALRFHRASAFAPAAQGIVLAVAGTALPDLAAVPLALPGLVALPLRHLLGEAARARVEALYGWDAVFTGLNGLYERLTGGRTADVVPLVPRLH